MCACLACCTKARVSRSGLQADFSVVVNYFVRQCCSCVCKGRFGILGVSWDAAALLAVNPRLNKMLQCIARQMHLCESLRALRLLHKEEP